jgi:hypothetical protein
VRSPVRIVRSQCYGRACVSLSLSLTFSVRVSNVPLERSVHYAFSRRMRCDCDSSRFETITSKFIEEVNSCLLKREKEKGGEGGMYFYAFDYAVFS